MNPNIQNSQQALAELQTNQSQAKNPNQILQESRQNLGVDQAQNTVTGLRTAIDNTTKLLKQVAPSVMGRTQGSLVTSAQANAQIGNEQRPITGQLTELGGQYGTAQQDLGSLQQRAAEASQGAYQGQQDKLGYLQNLYNTLYGREQAVEQARLAELQRQEQIRQFNVQQEAARRAAAAQQRLYDLSNPNLAAQGQGKGQTEDERYNEYLRLEAKKEQGYVNKLSTSKGLKVLGTPGTGLSILGSGSIPTSKAPSYTLKLGK